MRVGRGKQFHESPLPERQKIRETVRMMIERCRVCLLLVLLACAGESAPVPAGPPAATVSVANLSALRWIQGSWRAERTLGGQTLFFERYTFADESTLVVESYADSAMRVAPETTAFELRGARLTSRGAGPKFTAETITPTSVTFMPLEGAVNHFTWEYYSPNEWIARLSAPAMDGEPARNRRYHMRRMP